MRRRKPEMRHNFTNLEEAIRNRKSYIVLDALRGLSNDPENDTRDSFWPKKISEIIKDRYGLSFSVRYVYQILKELISLKVVEKEDHSGYYIPEEIADVLTEIHDALEKARCISGELVCNKHYRVFVLYEIKPEIFFTPLVFIGVTEKMKELGFKMVSLGGEEKNETWDWTFTNTQKNLVEIEVAFAEINREDMILFGRTEDYAVLLEIHIHIKENHRLYQDPFFEIRDLEGKIQKNTSFLSFEIKSSLNKEESLREYCRHLAKSTVVTVNEVLRGEFEDIGVMTIKTEDGETIIEEEWEDEDEER